MSRKLHIARDGVELGVWTSAETRELLRTGFLLPTDFFWTAGQADWQPLADWDDPAPESVESADHLARARRHVVAASGRLAKQAVRLRHRFQATAGDDPARLTETANRLLRAFLPRIRQLASHQAIAQSATRLPALLQNEVLMRKLFSALYTGLPSPVHRFVSRPMFVAFCLERRRELLAPPPTSDEEAASTDPPPA